MILFFFSLLILVVHTLSLKNLSDATLASLSISIYPRWRPIWKPLKVKILCDTENMSQTHFILKLYAMKLEAYCRLLACNQIKR